MRKIIRFGHEFNMCDADFIDMLDRMGNPYHPVGRSFSDCGVKSERL